jgi:sec-independent protein translocase protein TatB
MFNVGTGELIVIMVLALIVLGPDKLPSAARQAGRYLAEFRRITSGFQQEFRDAVDAAMDDGSGSRARPGSEPTAFKMPDLPALPDLPELPDVTDVSGPTERAHLPAATDHPSPGTPPVKLDKPQQDTHVPSTPPTSTPNGSVQVDGPPNSFR